jgi:hypothetical protein
MNKEDAEQNVYEHLAELVEKIESWDDIDTRMFDETKEAIRLYEETHPYAQRIHTLHQALRVGKPDVKE